MENTNQTMNEMDLRKEEMALTNEDIFMASANPHIFRENDENRMERIERFKALLVSTRNNG